MKNTAKIAEGIFNNLKQTEMPRSQFVNFMEGVRDPYIVLIACILSLRTKDQTTYPATMRMLEIAKTPEDMTKADLKKLTEAIYPVGFYQNKARQIIELSKRIVEEYGGKVPDSIEELVKFDGVGRKTANLVMAKGFNLPAICVDVHVHRIFNRLGLVNTKTPEETEMKLREIIPQKYWIELNTLFVTLGQNICKPTKPLCKNCTICEFCQTAKSSYSDR